MPAIPYLVSGTITDSKSVAARMSIISFETADGKANVIANSSGQYLYDLSNIGYTAGETVTYTTQSEYNNEVYSSTFTITGESKTLNVTLAPRKDALATYSSKSVQLANIGGFVINRDNPLPVEIVKNHDK